MFLLIRRLKKWPHSLKLIYIPLCFYLYGSSRGLMQLLSDLHSTMFLLIHNSFAEALDSVEIYIPLCFYLYLAGTYEFYIVFQFTFHYVSTYTWQSVSLRWTDMYLHSTMFLLILDPTAVSDILFINLHSTMFLLIPS